ncbi:glutathione transferase GstA [Xenorhabdus szentirmaii]|uniref:Glutathione S-transferase GST-6.0 n=2 Tax=Xenorhabdus szentirmaii TaxID=290112 RepID=W1IT38_9GAMM|nr:MULTISPECIES: glutathione transferase GstA [Xenorhabdus]MBD2780327.1 glutathione transferase GstA [Xenorhabdus sp. 38]MBD2793368.1 glutathione transferase GstA [Xenorhabdus sp. CUL]MBD2802651.1 glutathione transferase GstA [Xenorhabdus sp. M]MBD2804593.1 glutathione transferase GstA [Xenorhabdus sp. ZM]MBD2819624.1 glutathione transferase GstA [Xenorhabdus sp. 42]
MKLYYAPGTCSLSPHIILREAGVDFSMVRVDLMSKKTESGDNFLAINPKGKVPTLLLDNNEILTEVPAIVKYIADQKPDRNLIASTDTTEHYHQIEWLNYISSELHQNFMPLFPMMATPEVYIPIVMKKLMSHFEYINNILAERAYITGDHFTVADSYLFVVMRWIPGTKLDISGLVHLNKYLDKIRQRPHIQDALEAEGLI